MLRHLAFIAGLGALAVTTAAVAQQGAADYPNRPVKIIVTVPAGGGVDSVTRLIAEKLRDKLGQPFIVENRGGAAGNIGAEAVFNSDPDGYTLMASQPAPLVANQALYKKLNFDPAALVPVAVMSKIPNVLLVKNDFPAKTAKEFMDYVRANSGKVNAASQGIGTTSHLTAELFQKVTGTKLQHLPYRGTGPALNDIVAGHVDLIFMELSAAHKLHEGGKARVLAVMTDHRVPSLPDIPTMDEVGVKDIESDTFNAISAPPKTPPAIVAKLNAAVNEILTDPAMQARFKSLNLEAGGGSPEDMAKLVKSETQRWGDVIRAAGISMD
jgi:tripartite-type tricarboxylate transporter receptor subunit TctC